MSGVLTKRILKKDFLIWWNTEVTPLDTEDCSEVEVILCQEPRRKQR